MNTIKKQWFALAIIACLLLSYLLSQTGVKITESKTESLKLFLIICTFMLSGLTIETIKLYDSIKQWQAHCFIQSVIFVVFPLIVIAFGSGFAPASEIDPVYIGFVALACFPATLTSCVLLTQLAGGNHECALINANLSNVLGIFLTPLLIYFLLGKNIQIDVLDALKKLTFLVLIPFLSGQLLHRFLSIRISTEFSKLASNFMVLGIMFIAFFNAFQQGVKLALGEIVMILILCFLLHALMLALIWNASRCFTVFSLADRKCLTITASHKTMAMGLPIIAILFAGHPDLAVISLPLIGYHTIQLFVDGIVAGQMANIH